jgi:NADPH-dependent 2,4-dienoyl-CoA reductase/sulfur reductase-like enzyme
MTPARDAPVDVLVVGAGPAGLSSAVAAAERGRRVLVLDLGLRAGGQIWRHRAPAVLPRVARRWLERARVAGVTVATAARVVDVISAGEVVVDYHGRLDRQRTRALILATGAKERILPFPGWTLPGVVGVGGLQALIKSGLALNGSRVVVAGTGPLVFPVAAAAAKAGALVELVAEQAPLGRVASFGLGLLVNKPSAIGHAIGYRWTFRGAPLRTDCWITAAEGHGRLRRVHVHRRGESWAIDCDWLATSAGLSPNTELAQLLGCAITHDAVQVDDLQATTVPGVWAAGECTGVKGDAFALSEGEIAGSAAAGDPEYGRRPDLQRRRKAGRAFAETLATHFAPRPELLLLATDQTIICRCEDVRRGEIDPRWTQRQAKLWTRVGMGECQGAVCGPACAALFGWEQNLARPPLGAPLCVEWSSVLTGQREEPTGEQ